MLGKAFDFFVKLTPGLVKAKKEILFGEAKEGERLNVF